MSHAPFARVGNAVDVGRYELAGALVPPGPDGALVPLTSTANGFPVADSITFPTDGADAFVTPAPGLWRLTVGMYCAPTDATRTAVQIQAANVIEAASDGLFTQTTVTVVLLLDTGTWVTVVYAHDDSTDLGPSGWLAAEYLRDADVPGGGG